MIIVILFILGLCFGSFINAFVWRIHQQSLVVSRKSLVKNKTKDKQLTTNNYSILKGRSMCPNCKHALAWYDLIPLLSWLKLKGKCRYCKKPISVQYPVVELIMAVVFVWSYIAWPIDLASNAGIYSLAAWLVISVGLLALAVYDSKWTLIPDRIVFPLAGLAFILRLGYILLYETNIRWALIQWGLSILVASGIFLALVIVSKGQWIGDGDVALGLVTGTVLADPLLSFGMIFLASVIGLIVAIPSLIKAQKAMKTQIPYGPYLISASFVLVLYGDQIVSAYKRYALLE